MLAKKDDIPIAKVIFFITIAHIHQLFFVYVVVGEIFPSFTVFRNLPHIYVGFFMVLFLVLNYALLYKKDRWQMYLEEFKGESKSDSRRGWILVVAYLLGSVVLFFLTMAILGGKAGLL
jgi:hypothetical protein